MLCAHSALIYVNYSFVFNDKIFLILIQKIIYGWIFISFSEKVNGF